MIEFFQIPDHIADYCETVFRKTQLDWRYETSTLVGKSLEKARRNFGINNIIDGLKIYDNHSLTIMLEDPIVNFKHSAYKRFTPLHQHIFNNVVSLDNYKVLRVLMNLQIRSLSDEHLINYPHVDSEEETALSFLYYLNDSDGETYFFEDGKIVKQFKPKKGTGVLFNSNILHAGSKPRYHNDRIAINYMFKRT